MESMRNRLGRLFGAMAIAAYLTWTAVLVLLLDAQASRFDGTRTAAIVSMLAFLAALLLKQYLEKPGAALTPTIFLLLMLEGVLALMTCAFWPDSLSAILTVIFIADCSMILAPRVLIAVAMGLNAALWFIVTYAWEFPRGWRIVLAYSGFQIFAMLTAWYARRAEETSRQLRETNAHLLATRSLLEESARDHERLRLARELHDVAGHKLTALKLNLTALQREGGAPALDTAAQLATELLSDIRGVVAQIRQHDGLDVRAALTQLIAPLPAPRIHLTVSDDARVASVAQAEALLRVVQEALTNIVRHSGALNAWVELEREGDRIRLSVRDDGHAALPLHEGFGLTGMRERLLQLSGKLDISRATQGGVALDIRLPLQA
jgi:signal transduction histidine kinase